MGTAGIQGELWGRSPEGWATVQEATSRPLWEAMLDGADVRAGPRVLDAGCGAGGASLLMARRGAHVSGLDAAERLIEFARSRLPDSTFQVGDIEFLPHDDDAFDVVFAANSLQYAADTVATLRGFARVCRPGGRVVAGLFGPPEQVEFDGILRAVRDAMPDRPEGEDPFALSMPGVLEERFEAAGLQVEGEGFANCPFRYDDFETFWWASVSAGPWQKALEVAGQDRLMASVREAVEAFTLEDGRIEIEPNVFRFVVATV